MSKTHPQDFTCPCCQALYKLVRIKSDSGAICQTLQCVVCQHQLASMDSDDMLKYFLVSRPKTKESGNPAKRG